MRGGSASREMRGGSARRGCEEEMGGGGGSQSTDQGPSRGVRRLGQSTDCDELPRRGGFRARLRLNPPRSSLGVVRMCGPADLQDCSLELVPAYVRCRVIAPTG